MSNRGTSAGKGLEQEGIVPSGAGNPMSEKWKAASGGNAASLYESILSRGADLIRSASGSNYLPERLNGVP